ncbi:MAG TPA: hypothetical protein VGB99_10400 [Acidobacteriota bacterium]
MAVWSVALPLWGQAPVVVEHDHLIVEVAPFALRITEIAMIQVEGGAPLAAHSFHLAAPSRAQNLTLIAAGTPEAEPFEIAAGTVRNRIELAPGRYQIQFQYEVVDASATVRLSLPRAYPTAVIDILLPSGEVRASAAGLSSAGEFTVEGRSFQRLNGSDLPAGRPIELVLNRPAPDERRHDRAALWIMAALAGLAALAVLRSIVVARRSGVRSAPR